jgi:hypothetical protein
MSFSSRLKKKENFSFVMAKIEGKSREIAHRRTPHKQRCATRKDSQVRGDLR